MVALLARRKSINQFDFIDFLKTLRKKFSDNSRLFCLVDNLAVHRTKNVQEACGYLNIALVFNAPYSSPVNPIERCWAVSKRHFASECLRITNFKDKKLLVRKVLLSLDEVNSLTIRRHVVRCMRDMKEWLVDNCNY